MLDLKAGREREKKKRRRKGGPKTEKDLLFLEGMTPSKTLRRFFPPLPASTDLAPYSWLAVRRLLV
jgi:hypothetical protein